MDKIKKDGAAPIRCVQVQDTSLNSGKNCLDGWVHFKLSVLIDDAKMGLSVHERIPEAKWNAIAAHCGAPEVAEIKVRIAALKAELATIEEWDGDTQDDIHLAISSFSRLLVLTGTPLS